MTSQKIQDPSEPVVIITREQQAIEAAQAVATLAAIDVVKRDRERIYPQEALSLFSRSGLGSILVPRDYGGGGLSYATVAEVFRIISVVDPSLGQIPQNHFGLIQYLRDEATELQKQQLFGRVVAGARIGNGGPEKGARHTREVLARLHYTAQGPRLTGEKFYSTGALFADIAATTAIDDQGKALLAFIPLPAEGLQIIDDWSGIGQRTTASGTMRLEAVAVDPNWLVPVPATDKPSLRGPVSQLIQAAIDAGIARGAFEEAREFILRQSRPWVDAGVARNADDSQLQADVGKVYVRLLAAEATLRQAATVLDNIAAEKLDAATAARASIAVAGAKVLTTTAALLVSEKLLEWGGSRATLEQHGLDRHWRNARTHTLHDPVRWKQYTLGNYYLNGIEPLRHAWI